MDTWSYDSYDTTISNQNLTPKAIRIFDDLRTWDLLVAVLAFLAPAPWRNWSPVKTAACVCTAPDGAHPAGTPCVAIACNG